jgi:hypothetical protein
MKKSKKKRREEMDALVQKLGFEIGRLQSISTNLQGTLNAISSRLDDIWNHVRAQRAEKKL